jgi:uncharacterized protein
MMRKIISAILMLTLCLGLAVSVSADVVSCVWDEADLLTTGEEAWLEDKLSQVSSQYEAEIVIMTLESAGGRDMDALVEDVYDSMLMGYGANRDGVFLLLCMDVREYRILSNGFAGVAIDPMDIDRIGDVIVPYLSDGAYLAGFESFADECAYYLEGYLYGYPFDAGKNFLICLVIGVIAGVTVAFVLKGQLKTVRRQVRANAYVKSGSMQLTVCRDIFLYRNVRRSEKASSSSSGSSGSSRSVGGGRF